MIRALPVFLIIAAAAFPQTAVLNLSHDLTILGIASQDMSPNLPALDARPLFEAGVQYAQTHSIPLITCDIGTYYFLTGHPFGVYAFFNGLHDVTVDMAGSDIFFSLATWMGLECNNCRNVQFQNFTIDSVQLPFTQVRVTSVDTANNRINYTQAGSRPRILIRLAIHLASPMSRSTRSISATPRQSGEPAAWRSRSPWIPDS